MLVMVFVVFEERCIVEAKWRVRVCEGVNEVSISTAEKTPQRGGEREREGDEKEGKLVLIILG